MIPNIPIAFTAGAVAGVAMVFIGEPRPQIKQECETYKVSNQLVTSYVLKPPAVAPEVIHEKCPAPVSQKLSDEKPETIEPVVEEPGRHRRHHRRHRRYWR